MVPTSLAAAAGSSYTPTRTPSRPGGVTHSATGSAAGSQEFGDASPTDGLPQAAVNHATPSRVSKGDSGSVGCATADEVDGGTTGSSVAQPASTNAVPRASSAPATWWPRRVTDMPFFLPHTASAPRAEGQPHSCGAAIHSALRARLTRTSPPPPQSPDDPQPVSLDCRSDVGNLRAQNFRRAAGATGISAGPKESHRCTARYSDQPPGEPPCTPTRFRSPPPLTAQRSSCRTTPHPGSAATPC